MADYFTSFSCLLDVGTSERAMRALALYRVFSEELEREDDTQIGFLLDIDPMDSGTQLWIHDDGSGDPEHVITFVERCTRALDLSGRWGFEWANTCSKPRLDAFGGGAHLIDLATGDTLASVSTNEWLVRHLAGDAGGGAGDA